MIDKIIYFSLHNRLAVLIGALVVILGGLYAVQKMDIDVFPDLTAPTVVVMSDCRGMAAEETERLVTFPIETAMNGATNVRRVRSASNFGYSYVWVEFDWGMDVFRARQIVSEKMMTLSESLPAGTMPQLAPQSSVMGEILFIGLTVDNDANANTSTSMMELRSIADWVLKPAILATGGVSQVTIIGGDYKQYQVLADPQLMNAYGVTMQDVTEAVSTMSVNSEGGVIRDYGNEYALRGIGRTNDLEELKNTPLKASGNGTLGLKNNGTPETPWNSETPSVLTLGDVAQVVTAPAVKMGTASLDGRSAIILSVSKQPSINTLEVTRQIEAKLEEVRKSLPADVHLHTDIFRQADFIEASVDNVGHSLIEGAILCIIVLFLFLGSFRTTIISVIAIPLSLLGTLIVLWWLDMEINTMTLGGMCIAIGSLVDDAIIDVENVYKHLRKASLTTGKGRGGASFLEVIFHASKEIRSSIMNATLIVMVAFMPMFFLSGMEGRMLKPLGITYIIALGMSLIVAMTVTPLCCRLLLSNVNGNTNASERSFVVKMKEGYAKSLRWALGHQRLVMGSTLAALVIAVVMMMNFGSSFLPAFNEGALTISAVCKPGVSLDESDHIGRLLEQRIHEVPEVVNTSRRTGRGELDEHSQTTNACEIDVNFDGSQSGRSAEEITQDIRHRMALVPGVTSIVGQPLGHRIDHMISGTRASIAIKLFGTDLNEMYTIGQKIKSEIADVEGLVDVNVDQQIETPQLHLRPNRLAMARYGITMEQFNQLVTMGFAGEKVGEIYEGQRSYDLVLRLSPQYTGSIEGVRQALIDTGDGRKVPLEAVCEIVSTSGPNNISRENVQRKLVIAANVSGRDVGSVVEDIQQIIAQEIRLPEGYQIEYGGQFESSRNATRILLIATLLALVVIYLLLYGEFRSFSLSGIVMCGLPLALIGGALGIALTSWVMSIPSIIGFITLFGIATRNGILLISRYRQVDVITGSVDRLNPILMTALTSALALVPMVLAGDKAGNEIQSPMAIVVLGGLLTSTLLNLYVMPIIYENYSKKHSAVVAD